MDFKNISSLINECKRNHLLPELHQNYREYIENKLQKLFDIAHLSHDDWIIKIQKIPSNELIINFKFLVLYEKFCSNTSGSAAENIPFFLEIQRRGYSDPILLDWTFKNKSDNSYTPFGEVKYGGIRSYEEYVEFKKAYRKRLNIHANTAEEDKRNKELRIIEKQKNHELKIKRNKIQKDKLDALVEKYKASNKKNLLKDIIDSKLPFPLFMLPKNEVDLLQMELDKLNKEMLTKLLDKIPKRAPNHFKKLRKRIINLKNVSH